MWYEMLPSEDKLMAMAKKTAAKARAERTKQIAAVSHLYAAAILARSRVRHIPVKYVS